MANGEEKGMQVAYEIEELVPIVARLAHKMTGGESTSITYEKAQQLMEAVLYCIREWECEQEGAAQIGSQMHVAKPFQREQQESEGQLIQRGQRISAEQAYELGLACVTKKVKLSLALYNKMMETFDSYGNHCLQDTIVKGIPEFFKWYDVKFAPQDTILTLDYPVQEDLRKYTGVDAIWEYLCCIRQEQRYLGKLPRNFVVESLKSYCEDYEDMIENLRQIVDDYSGL